jgi:hypothetical protein
MLTILPVIFLLAGTPAAQATAPIMLEIRAFDGAEEVTEQTRITVHRAGERTSPVAQIAPREGRLEIQVPPGIYDVQAIRERDGRVAGIKWAERLVVMLYPDEAGHHLEVVNFGSGFGALQVRVKGSGAVPEVAAYAAGARDKDAAPRHAGPGYALFVLPAGSYDLQARVGNRIAWHSGIEVPLDRTRLWLVP